MDNSTLPELVTHSGPSNYSFLSPDDREAIDAVKDQIRAGDRVAVNQTSSDAISAAYDHLNSPPEDYE